MFATHFPAAADTAAIVEKKAVAGVIFKVLAVYFSYDGTATGSLTIESDSTVYFQVDVTGGDVNYIEFDEPITANRGENLKVTLAAGGTGVTGKLNVHFRREP